MPTEKAHGFQIMKTIERFLIEGAEVTLLLPNRKNPITDSLQNFYGLKVLPKIFYVPNYVGFLEKYFHSLYFFIQRILFAVSSFLTGLFSSADIVYSRELTISFFLALFGKIVVFEDHEPKTRFRVLYLFFLRHIPYKVVVAKNLLNLYSQAGISQSSSIVVPNGVELAEFDMVKINKSIWQEVGIPKNTKIILYVGHFYRWKGVYDLVSTSEYLSPPSVDWRIVMIGGTTVDQKKITEYIDERHITGVTILPFMNHKRIVEYIKSADVLVLPNTAVEERSRNYTTPIKLFEYMASGVPIVATNLSSFSDYIQDGENAVMSEPDNVRMLALSIQQVISDEDLGARISKKARKDVEKYTWEERGRKIFNLFHRVLS